MYVNKKKVAILVFLILVLGVLFYLNTPKNCKRDYECFSSKVSECSKAKVTTNKEDNLYYYEVMGKKLENCIVSVKLLKLSDAQPFDLRRALEGKGMLCSLPMSVLQNSDIKDIKNLNDYCTGQLKEAILDVTLQKLYDIVVQNIGPIASEIRGVSNNVSVPNITSPI